MRKLIAAALALLATGASALTLRPFSGTVIDPSGATIASGKVIATPTGAVPGSVSGGQVVPVPETYPVVTGAITCSGGCTIASPANYKFQVYRTVSGVDQLVWTFTAGVPEASGTVTLTELYSATASVNVNPAYMLVGGDVAQLGSGTATLHQVLSANGTAGFVWWNPPGTGTVTDVTAGTGLSGGGSGGALTLNLANTAVTAGAYGTGLGKAAGFTVDAQGRLTAASERSLGQTDISGLGASLALLAPIASPTFTGTVTGTFTGNLTGNVTGNVTGNADTATNGVVTTGSYANPAWITSLAGSKVSGSVAASDDGLSSATGTAPLALSLAAKALTGSLAITPANPGGAVALQASTPGTQQTGSLNLSGTVRAGAFVGNVTGDVTGNATTSTDGLTSASGTPPLGLSLSSKALTGSITITAANNGGAVALQSVTPGTQQTGNLNVSGTVKANAFVGSLAGDASGNAGTVTNGVYTSGSYSDPTWISSLSGTKLTGTVIATNGVVTTGSYSNPSWLTSFAGAKVSGSVPASDDGVTSAGGTAPLTLSLAAKALTGSIAITAADNGGAVALQAMSPGTQQTGNANLSGTVKASAFVGGVTGNLTGNADTVTNGLYSTGTYSNPSWLTSLAGSKITGDISGNAGTVTNGLYNTGAYSNPSWITSLDGAKITGTIAANANTASAFAIAPTQCGTHYFATGIGVSGNANCSQAAFSDLSGVATWGQVSTTGSNATDLGSGAAPSGYALVANGSGGTAWSLVTGTYTPPAGTGFPHITAGVQDSNAKLVSNVDVDSAAGILWSKINTTGALPGEVGAAPIAQGLASASGTAPLTLTFSSNALTGSIANATVSTLGVVELLGDLGGTATSPSVLSVGGSSAANINTAEIAANAATAANTPSTIVKRDASGNLSAGTITANLVGEVAGSTIVDTSPGTGNASGRKLVGTCGTTLTPGQVAYFSASDSRWYPAEANSAAASGPVAIAMVVTGGTAGYPCTLLISGTMEISGWALTKGALYYVSDVTPGGISSTVSTIGSQIRAVGHALSPTVLQVEQTPDFGEKAPPEIVYNIKAYGAYCDGSHDDTAAVQAAVTAAAAAGGGIVFHPGGASIILSTITIPVKVSLAGVGHSSIFEGAAGITVFSMSSVTQTSYWNSISDIWIQLPTTAGVGIYIKNVFLVEIKNLTISEGDYSIQMDGAVSVVDIHNCHLLGANYGIMVNGTYALVALVRGNEIAGATAGVYLGPTVGGEVTLSNNSIEGCTGPGVHIVGSATASSVGAYELLHNHFESNTGYDIDINPEGNTGGPPSVVVQGGILQGSGVSPGAIRMNAATTALTVRDAYLSNHTTAGIVLGNLSLTTANIVIGKNMAPAALAEATPISSTNPSITTDHYNNAGMRTVVTVRDSGGSADCTMTYSDGILTATTCSHT